MSVRRSAAESMRQRVLAIITHRVSICAAEEARQEGMNCKLGAATERSAKFEAELIGRMISELPVLSRSPSHD